MNNDNKLSIEYNNIFLEEKEILNKHQNNNINLEDEGLYDINTKSNLISEYYKKNQDYNESILKNISKLKTKFFNKNVNVVATGPYIRSIIFPNSKYKINKEFVFTIISDDININNHLINNNNKTIVLINDLKIIINSNVFKSVSEFLLSNSYLDRICIHKGIIKVSRMFILELYKFLKIDNENDKIDPFLKKPRDLLCIYEKNNNSNLLVNMINLINYSDLERINIDEYCNSLINYDDSKLGLTIIEYLLLKIKNEKNYMLKYNLKNILRELSKYTFLRSPKYFYFINEMDKDKLNNNIFEILELNSYEYDIKNKKEIESLIISNNTNIDSIINNINIDIIKRIILSDDSDNFILFLKNINYENRIFNNTKSNTGKKIIDLIIDNNSKSIINELIDNSIVNTHYKFYLCLMTENLNILEKIKNIENYNDILINYLEEILENGLLKSFYYLLKLDKNTIINYKSENNDNILHLLGNKNNSDYILDLILKLNINLVNERNNRDETPLHIYSKKCYNEKILKLLNITECDYKLLDKDNNTFLHCLGNFNYDKLKDIIKKTLSIVDYQNNNGETILIKAIKNNNENLFYILKGFNANMKIKDINGNTVYHYICHMGNCCGITIPFIENNYGYHPIDYCTISTNYYNFINI